MSTSQLDAAGAEQITESGRARLDLRDHELTPADVGIPADRTGPIVGRPGDNPVELTLVGPDEEETVSTSTFGATFLTTGEAAKSITWFESYDTEDEAFAALDAATDRWGLTREAIANWRQTFARGGEQEVSPAALGGPERSGHPGDGARRGWRRPDPLVGRAARPALPRAGCGGEDPYVGGAAGWVMAPPMPSRRRASAEVSVGWCHD